MAAVSLKYIRKIQNKYTECRHIGDKPLSEPMMTKFFFIYFYHQVLWYHMISFGFNKLTYQNIKPYW